MLRLNHSAAHRYALIFIAALLQKDAKQSDWRISDNGRDHMRTCICGFLITAFLFWSEHLQNLQIANAQEHLNNTIINTQPNKSVWQRTTDDPVALYTLVLSVFTGFLVFVTGGLIWVSYRQILLTKAVADRQTSDTEIIQRAYVNVEPGGLTEHRDRDDRLHTTVIFRNVGHLPARNLHWYGTFGNV